MAPVRGAPSSRVVTSGVSSPLPARDEILAALASFPDELERVVLNGHDDDALRQPGSDGGWGVVEILPHLRDWEEIYLERAQRVVDEERPYLPGYDDELWPIERDYRAQDPRVVLAHFRELREAHVRYLESLPPEAWDRPGEHGYFGEITLGWMENHVTEHDAEHLAQVRDVLAS